jgi:hypothetical protein
MIDNCPRGRPQTKRLGGSGHSPPRLDLREYHLPWAHLSIPCAGGRGKALLSRRGAPVAAAACSKAASASFDLPVPRAVIAARPVATRPVAGAAGRRVGAGGPVSRARPVAGSSADVGGGASRWSFSPNCRRSPRPWPRRRPGWGRQPPRRARASAQQPFLKKSRRSRASGPVATPPSSRSPGHRNSIFAVARAVRRYDVSSIARDVGGGGGGKASGHAAGGRGPRSDAPCACRRVLRVHR